MLRFILLFTFSIIFFFVNHRVESNELCILERGIAWWHGLYVRSVRKLNCIYSSNTENSLHMQVRIHVIERAYCYPRSNIVLKNSTEKWREYKQDWCNIFFFFSLSRKVCRWSDPCWPWRQHVGIQIGFQVGYPLHHMCDLCADHRIMAIRCVVGCRNITLWQYLVLLLLHLPWLFTVTPLTVSLARSMNYVRRQLKSRIHCFEKKIYIVILTKKWLDRNSDLN
jgi:hypothetical protein